ncbi:MAG: formylglycine-generating enzyme family protein, partial [Armatimonadota bacterium]
MRAVLWGIASGLVLASACQPSPKAEAERHPLVTAALIVKEPGPTPSGMTWVPGGQMFIGNKEGQMDEQPVRLVYLDGFWMDTTEVTTRQFAEFVSATKYVTVAERGIPADKSPTGAAVPPGSLVWVKF